MADKLKELVKKLESTPWGTVLVAAAYALMLLLVLMFFTGNGQFLYEL